MERYIIIIAIYYVSTSQKTSFSFNTWARPEHRHASPVCNDSGALTPSASLRGLYMIFLFLFFFSGSGIFRLSILVLCFPHAQTPEERE